MTKADAEPFRVPTEFRPTIGVLASLTATQQRALLDSLRAAEPSLSIPTLLEKVATSTSLPIDQAGKILSVLINASLAVDEGRHPSKVAETIAAHLPLDEHSEQKRKTVIDLVSAILSLEPFGIAAKAASVVLDDERVFHDARILTDIRPIFSPDLEPRRLVILHQLRLTFLESGQINSIYVTLVPKDLERLEAIIKRARRKVKAVKGTVSGPPFVEV